MMDTTEHHHPHDHEHEPHAHHASMQDWLKTALLFGLGLYFVVLIATGSLTNYINVRFSWLSYVAAAIFLLLGAASAYHLRHLNAHDHAHSHDHEHATLSWAALLVVAAPLIFGTLIPTKPLGAAAMGGDLNTSSIGGDSSAAFGKPPEQRNILDWVRTFNVSEDPASVNGQPVDVIGFVYRDKDYPAGTFMVARFTISCCVADAVAIGLPVAWQDDLPSDTWVEVKGQFAPGEFQGKTQPVIQPASVEVVDQPEHPYLYP